MRIEGTTAIVTGGASGLGAATVERLAASGATVAVLDRDGGAARAVADRVGGVGLTCDVTDGPGAEAAVDQVVDRLGPVRVLVCCAGIGDSKRVVGRAGPHPLDLFERVVAVNLTGTFNLVRLVAQHAAGLDPVEDDGERAVLITTASIAATDGVDGGVAYAASKGGVAAMTLALARDLAPHAIRAVSLSPGSFTTPMTDGMPPRYVEQLADETPFPPRFGQPSEFAALVEHVIVNPFLNGTDIRLDGGLRMRASRLR